MSLHQASQQSAHSVSFEVISDIGYLTFDEFRGKSVVSLLK